MPYDKYNSPKKKKENWAKRLKLNVEKELSKKGKHSPAGIKYMKTLQKAKPTIKTKATERINRRLRRAGITEKEIKSLGG